MPPKAMFKNKDRPGGMEYGCCAPCNHGSRTSDATAAFVAHSTSGDDWKVPRLVELFGTIKLHEPDFPAEFFRSGNQRDIHLKQASGLITSAKKVRLDGPVVNRHLTIFSAKLGMALFREHTGEPMPENSGVFLNWFGTPSIEQSPSANALIDMLPELGELKQGTKQSKDQFIYHYLSDSKTVVAAFMRFHTSLHINVVAIADLAKYGRHLSNNNRLTLVKHGELLNLMKSEK